MMMINKGSVNKNSLLVHQKYSHSSHSHTRRFPTYNSNKNSEIRYNTALAMQNQNKTSLYHQGNATHSSNISHCPQIERVNKKQAVNPHDNQDAREIAFQSIIPQNKNDDQTLVPTAPPTNNGCQNLPTNIQSNNFSGINHSNYTNLFPEMKNNTISDVYKKLLNHTVVKLTQIMRFLYEKQVDQTNQSNKDKSLQKQKINEDITIVKEPLRKSEKQYQKERYYKHVPKQSYKPTLIPQLNKFNDQMNHTIMNDFLVISANICLIYTENPDQTPVQIYTQLIIPFEQIQTSMNKRLNIRQLIRNQDKIKLLKKCCERMIIKEIDTRGLMYTSKIKKYTNFEAHQQNILSLDCFIQTSKIHLNDPNSIVFPITIQGSCVDNLTISSKSILIHWESQLNLKLCHFDSIINDQLGLQVGCSYLLSKKPIILLNVEPIKNKTEQIQQRLSANLRRKSDIQIIFDRPSRTLEGSKINKIKIMLIPKPNYNYDY